MVSRVMLALSLAPACLLLACLLPPALPAVSNYTCMLMVNNQPRFISYNQTAMRTLLSYKQVGHPAPPPTALSYTQVGPCGTVGTQYRRTIFSVLDLQYYSIWVLDLAVSYFRYSIMLNPVNYRDIILQCHFIGRRTLSSCTNVSVLESLAHKLLH